MNNTKFTNEEKQIFYGDYPLVAQSLPLKTTVIEGDVIGVDAEGNYGKYDEEGSCGRTGAEGTCKKL